MFLFSSFDSYPRMDPKEERTELILISTKDDAYIIQRCTLHLDHGIYFDFAYLFWNFNDDEF